MAAKITKYDPTNICGGHHSILRRFSGPSLACMYKKWHKPPIYSCTFHHSRNILLMKALRVKKISTYFYEGYFVSEVIFSLSCRVTCKTLCWYLLSGGPSTPPPPLPPYQVLVVPLGTTCFTLFIRRVAFFPLVTVPRLVTSTDPPVNRSIHFTICDSPAIITRHRETVLAQCWASVVDGGPILSQHWLNVSCLMGRDFGPW